MSLPVQVPTFDEWGAVNGSYEHTAPSVLSSVPPTAPPRATSRYPLFFGDTETFLLTPGVGAPPIVCLQFAVDDGKEQIIHARDPACYRTVRWALESCFLSFHNLAFDACVFMAAYPDLIPLVFDCLDADRASDTIVRQKLIEIATGRYKVFAQTRGAYTLDGVARRLGLELNIDKADPWRLRYGTLYNTPLSQWPKEALAYALNDATAQRAVHKAQDEYVQRKYTEFHPALGLKCGADMLRDQFRQTRAALWLRLLECRGIRVDPIRVEEYIENVKVRLLKDRDIAVAEGLIRGPMRPLGHKGTFKPFSADIAAAMRRMVEVCRLSEEPELPVTETGDKVLREMFGLKDKQPYPKGATYALWEKHQNYIKLDEDSCDIYGDDVLEAYQRARTAATQLSRAERLRHGTTTPIQASFQTLIDTGRTACRQGDVKPGQSPSAWGAQLQNPAKDKYRKSKKLDDGRIVRGELIPGTRELFIPRGAGRWYDPLALANPNIPREDLDPQGGAWRTTKGYRFCSTDYGSMELCGVAQLCLRKVHESRLAQVLREGRDPHTELGATLLGIPAQEAYARKNGDRGEELQKHFNDKVRQTAKVGNFGFWGAMGAEKMVIAARKQYGVSLGAETDDPDERVPWKKAVQAAQDLRDAWFATWPEARQYFNYISRLMREQGYGPEDNRRVVIMQMGSQRLRGGLWFTHAANTGFQGFCADIAKDAIWRITREMFCAPSSPLYGSRVVNFLHDEPFSELLIENDHEAAYRQAQIQTDVASEWAPDVKWACEPAIMDDAWYKAAEAVHMVGGQFCKASAPGARLVPWNPETDKKWKAWKKAANDNITARAA
jgi:hypothetical protein